MDDEEIQARVNNAVAAEEGRQDDPRADDPDNVSDDPDLEDLEDADDADIDDEEDDPDEDPDQRKPKSSKRSDEGAAPKTPAADADDSDDDDASLDYKQPNLGSKVTVEPFDINKLPRNEFNQVDPEVANRAINEHNQKVAEAQEANARTLEENKRLLTTQWQRGFQKFPHLKSRELHQLASEMHLNSIGTDNYLTPYQALQRVDKMYKKAARSGAQQQRSKRTVERMGRSESSSGRSTTTGKPSKYETARKMAMSQDPVKAAQGRRLIIRYRREARNRR